MKCFAFFFIFQFIFLLSFGNCFGQKIKYDIDGKKVISLSSKVESYLKEKQLDLTIGISVIEIDREKNAGGFNQVYSNNNLEARLLRSKTEAFPTMSVYKFHLALAILKEIDKGKFDLNDELFITKSDLLEETYSPLKKNLRRIYKEDYEKELTKGLPIQLSKLLSYMGIEKHNYYS